MKRGTDGALSKLTCSTCPRESIVASCSSQRAGRCSDTKSVLNDMGKKLSSNLDILTALLKGTRRNHRQRCRHRSDRQASYNHQGARDGYPRFKANIVRIHFYTTNGGFRCDSATAERRDIKGGEVSLPAKVDIPAPKPGDKPTKLTNKSAKGSHLMDGLNTLVTYANASCSSAIRASASVFQSNLTTTLQQVCARTYPRKIRTVQENDPRSDRPDRQ